MEFQIDALVYKTRGEKEKGSMKTVKVRIIPVHSENGGHIYTSFSPHEGKVVEASFTHCEHEGDVGDSMCHFCPGRIKVPWQAEPVCPGYGTGFTYELAIEITSNAPRDSIAAAIVHWLINKNFALAQSDENVVILSNTLVRISIGYRDGELLYSTQKGRIAIDNEKAFDKWGTVPVSIILPEKVEDIDWNRIEKAIEFMCSPAGFDLSDSFGQYDFDEIVKEKP
jgi:hypothetical protein